VIEHNVATALCRRVDRLRDSILRGPVRAANFAKYA
jgi:hypothetical protein